MGFEFADKNIFTFEQFSMQYLSIILGIFMLILINLNNIRIFLKISQYATVSVVAFLAFISYHCIVNLYHLNHTSQEIESIIYITPDFPDATGTFALSYMIHNSVVPIFR